MLRYNTVSRILLILTVITFALAAPVQVQEKRQACVHEGHIPEDMTIVLGKRTLDEDLEMLWDGLWHYDNVWGNRNPAAVHPQALLPESSDRESVVLDGDPPPGSPGSGHPDSTPANSESSSESEDWYTPPSSLGSPTEESESDPDRWSTISNAPSTESQSENLKAADTEMRGKAKVSRHISGTASGVDTVNAAQMEMELRSAVDPGPDIPPPW